MRLLFCFSLIFTVTLGALVAQSSAKPPLYGKGPLPLTELWQSSGSDEAPLSEVARLRVSSTGEIFVMDRKHFKIFVFSLEGKLLRSFGKQGEGPGEFRMMIDFHLSPNQLTIVDMNTLHLFDLSGKYIKTVNLQQQEGMVMPLFFVDDEHFVYAPRKEMEKVGKKELKIFNTSDQTSKTILTRSAESLETKMPGMQGGTVVVVSSGALREAEGLIGALRPGNTFLWNFNGSPELVICDLAGKEINRFAALGANRAPINRAAKEASLKNMRININGGAPPKEMLDMLINNIPDQSTYYFFLGAGPESQAPIAAYVSQFGRNDGLLIDLFSAKGEYIYQGDWKLGEGAEMARAEPVFFQDRFYATFTDAEGNTELHAYRVNPFKK